MEIPGKILIVGGGASGVLCAVALLRSGVDPSQIDIVEPRELLGEGLAYQTRDPQHRLNVPTGQLSASEDLPDDFAKWCEAPGYSFMERGTYSTYLRERLGKGCNHIRAFVTDLTEISDRSVTATFSRGASESYLFVVLAMGHGKARIPRFLQGVPESPRIIRDVWDGAVLPESRTLLFFGTGLSFIDVALIHLSRDSRNTVIAISGSGNLPERHVLAPITPFSPTISDVSTLSKLREYLTSAGDMWREAIDGLRPITETMWRGFTMEEKKDFLRTDGSWWSRRRHRIAPEVADQVEAKIESGRIKIIKGNVIKVDVHEDQVTVSLDDGTSHSGEYLAITIGRDYALSDPLTLNLLKVGKASRGPLGMGLSVEVATGLLQRMDGTFYPQIFAIGSLRSGDVFETTAIPEIRKQATAIAERIVSNSKLTPSRS